MAAPVCNVSPKIPPALGQVPALPAIPTATDPASTMAAVNAIRNWIIQFLGPSGGGSLVSSGPSGDFVEVTKARITTPTRIYDPNDPTKQTYIDVNQITGMKFQNAKTKQSIVWSQGPQ